MEQQMLEMQDYVNKQNDEMNEILEVSCGFELYWLMWQFGNWVVHTAALHSATP